jgi:hypothetical protein
MATSGTMQKSDNRKPAQDLHADIAMSIAAALDQLFDRHGRIQPCSDPRLHSLRQAAMWLLEYHGALQDGRSQRLANADASQLLKTLRRIASPRRPRDPFRYLPAASPRRSGDRDCARVASPPGC